MMLRDRIRRAEFRYSHSLKKNFQMVTWRKKTQEWGRVGNDGSQISQGRIPERELIDKENSSTLRKVHFKYIVQNESETSTKKLIRKTQSIERKVLMQDAETAPPDLSKNALNKVIRKLPKSWEIVTWNETGVEN